jgi:hypothetical protein
VPLVDTILGLHSDVSPAPVSGPAAMVNRVGDVMIIKAGRDLAVEPPPRRTSRH